MPQATQYKLKEFSLGQSFNLSTVDPLAIHYLKREDSVTHFSNDGLTIYITYIPKKRKPHHRGLSNPSPQLA